MAGGNHAIAKAKAIARNKLAKTTSGAAATNGSADGGLKKAASTVSKESRARVVKLNRKKIDLSAIRYDPKHGGDIVKDLAAGKITRKDKNYVASKTGAAKKLKTAPTAPVAAAPTAGQRLAMQFMSQPRPAPSARPAPVSQARKSAAATVAAASANTGMPVYWDYDPEASPFLDTEEIQLGSKRLQLIRAIKKTVRRFGPYLTDVEFKDGWEKSPEPNLQGLLNDCLYCVATREDPAALYGYYGGAVRWLEDNVSKYVVNVRGVSDALLFKETEMPGLNIKQSIKDTLDELEIRWSTTRMTSPEWRLLKLTGTAFAQFAHANTEGERKVAIYKAMMEPVPDEDLKEIAHLLE